MPLQVIRGELSLELERVPFRPGQVVRLERRGVSVTQQVIWEAFRGWGFR